MQIGIVTYALYIGGVEIAIETLAKHFIKLGYSVDIIETLTQGTEAQAFRDKGFSVKTTLIKPFETRNSYAKRLANEFSKYDVLILNNVAFVHYALGLLSSKTIVLPILHNISEESYGNLLINNREWDRAICVSYALEKKLIERRDIDKGRVVTIPTGVEVASAFPKASFNLQKPLSLLFVGRIDDESKGVLLLPKIVKLLSSKSNKEFHLKVIGDGPSKVDLIKAIDKNSLQNHIKLLGSLPHNQAIEAMREADLLIMPSYHEGQGLVYLEAMAQGLIPIASNLKDNTNLVIKDGKNGFLCEIGDVECFANKILHLLEHKELIEQLSKEAYSTAKESLSSEVMAKRYEQLIKEIRENRQTIRSKKLDKIPFGALPNILYQAIHLVIRVKNKIGRLINNGT